MNKNVRGIIYYSVTIYASNRIRYKFAFNLKNSPDNHSFSSYSVQFFPKKINHNHKRHGKISTHHFPTFLRCLSQFSLEKQIASGVTVVEKREKRIHSAKRRELIMPFYESHFHFSNKGVQQLREYFLSVIQLYVTETEG